MALSRISRLLDDLPIQKLTLQARHLLELQQMVRAELPPELASFTSVASLSSGKLTLLVDNGAVAAKLRHLSPRLREKLVQCAVDVTAIQLRVQPNIQDNPLHRKKKSVGHEGRRAFLTLADRLPSSPLRSALQRLAFHRSENEQKAFEDKERYKGQQDK